jgi:hypothetical protein
MSNALIISTRHLGRDHSAVDHLRQEIAFFEGRLTELREPEASPQTRTLRRAYRALLQERRQQLASYGKFCPN